MKGLRALHITKSVKLTSEEKAELGGPISEDIPTALTIEDLIDTVRLHCGLSHKVAKRAVFGLLHTMIEELKRGGDVRMAGIGTLWLRRQPPYIGKNQLWHKGEQPLVEPSARVFFTPSKVMAAELNPHLYLPREPRADREPKADKADR